MESFRERYGIAWSDIIHQIDGQLSSQIENQLKRRLESIFWNPSWFQFDEIMYNNIYDYSFF